MILQLIVVLCDCIFVLQMSFANVCSLRPVKVCCDRFVCDLCVDYNVNCVNVSKVLQLYGSTTYITSKEVSQNYESFTSLSLLFA